MIQKRKKLLIAANWKMTPATLQEARKKALSFKLISKKYLKVPKSTISIQVLVCPPYPFISDVQSIFKNAPATVGAQDISPFDGGSKTAEVASTMIQSIGATHCIVGHSERRTIGDTDEIVSVKMGQILRLGMSPILCIGESVRDAEGLYLEDIKKQMKASLERMNNSDFSRLVIAYEPVWAVGNQNNVALSGHDLHQMVIYIKKVLRDLYNDSISGAVKILYGGSVTPENAEDIIWNGEVDGLLLGRVSFDPKTYEAVCKAIITPTLEAETIATRQKIRNIKKTIKRQRTNSAAAKSAAKIVAKSSAKYSAKKKRVSKPKVNKSSKAKNKTKNKAAKKRA